MPLTGNLRRNVSKIGELEGKQCLGHPLQAHMHHYPRFRWRRGRTRSEPKGNNTYHLLSLSKRATKSLPLHIYESMRATQFLIVSAHLYIAIPQ